MAAAPPTDEEVSLTVSANIETQHCDLVVKLQRPGWIIRSVILYSDTLLKGGSFVVHPSESSSQCVVPLSHTKNGAESVDVRILIGAGINAPFFFCHQIPAF